MLRLAVLGEPFTGVAMAAFGRARKEPWLMVGRDSANERFAGRDLSRADSRPMVSCAEVVAESIKAAQPP